MEDTPIEIITTALWEVRVPIISLYSDQEIADGNAYIGRDEYGNAIEPKDRFRTVSLTIERMMEINKEGYAVRIAQEKTILRIYDIIEKHLLTAKEYYTNNLNTAKDFPFEDLKDLENFANKIFKSNSLAIVDSLERFEESEDSLVPKMGFINKETAKTVAEKKVTERHDIFNIGRARESKSVAEILKNIGKGL